MAQITFIIPSIRRPTLQRTIESLKNQTNPNWKAIVIFDGVDPIISDDSRIECMKIEKIGYSKCAGYVRNAGMTHVTTEWIGFVDDDDVITPNYVECFLSEKNGNDVIIFRMMYEGYSSKKINIRTQKLEETATLPPKDSKNFILGKVGISFSMKTSLFHEGFQFEPHMYEDFNLLNKIRTASKKILLSNSITYIVSSKTMVT